MVSFLLKLHNCLFLDVLDLKLVVGIESLSTLLLLESQIHTFLVFRIKSGLSELLRFHQICLTFTSYLVVV